MFIEIVDQETRILKPNHTNIIQFDSCDLYMPIVNGMCQLQIIFTEEGEYRIYGCGKMFKIGKEKALSILITPGSMGSDTQPVFVFLPNKDYWQIISFGNFIMLDGDICNDQ